MRKLLTLAFALSVQFGWSADAPPAGTQIDKTQLEHYIRYAEGILPGVKMTVGELSPTASPELLAVPVVLTLGDQIETHTYYVTADGKEIVGGKLWYLNQSPFADVLKQLPTNGPAFGPANAPVTVVVFSDFECPYCRQLARTIRDNIPKTYPTQVRVVFQDFPLQRIHPWAYEMAEAARCVWDGKNDGDFWALHDWVFEHQGEFTPDNVKPKVSEYAKEHHLDSARIASCMDAHASKPAIDQSVALATRLGLDQTPVVFVNGRMLAGAQKWDTLDAVIKLDLARNQESSEPKPGKVR